MEDQDKLLFDKLPVPTKRKMFTEFFYSDFLDIYNGIFAVVSQHKRLGSLKRSKIMKVTTAIGNKLNCEEVPIDWKNESYQDMVYHILRILEPKFPHKSVILKQNA